VVLARADDFADALAGTPLATRKVGPLLLSSSGQLDAAVRSEIGRVLSRGATVYLLGGSGALSSAVESALVADGYRIVRLAGADRYDTAVRIADVGLGNPTMQVLVTGLGFADALAAGAAAARIGASVLLTAGDQLSAPTSAYLRDHSGSRVAVGGQAAKALPSAEAVAGADRYDTAVRVARRFFTNPTEIGVASGRQFPDALAGSAHIGSRGGPLLLVSTEVPRVVSQYLSERRSGSLVVDIYGGTAAVSTAVSNQIATTIK
jgi:putative cell wall-binding protein